LKVAGAALGFEFDFMTALSFLDSRLEPIGVAGLFEDSRMASSA
jgi:hypothetical protein